MVKIIKKLLIAFVVALAILTGAGFLLPSKLHVKRSIVISATPEIIFPKVNELKVWQDWAPWHLRDPTMGLNFWGPDSGVGAVSTWKNGTQGSGTMMISESNAGRSITLDLDFGESGKATSFWTFVPAERGSTEVTWAFDTDLGMNPASRYLGLWIGRVIGRDYQTGLENLKGICEAEVYRQG